MPRIRPGGQGFETVFCRALVAAAAAACAQAAGIAAHAARLHDVAPKLRAKGAGEVIKLLLNEEAVAGTLRTEHMTRWGTRRLFERLTDFGAVTELSGQESFKLFGL
jgi:hypothetical protein